MRSKRKLLIRIAVVLAVIGLGIWMSIIGRGHTVYFDNKKLTGPDGTIYEPRYQIQVFVDDESAGKLKAKDRGMASVMGQDFSMVLHITPEKDAKKFGAAVSLKLPYSMDGIIINLPALLDGAPEEVYMSEFIQEVVEEEIEDETMVDEFGLPIGE